MASLTIPNPTVPIGKSEIQSQSQDPYSGYGGN